MEIPANCRVCAVRREVLCAPLSDREMSIVESFRSGHRTLAAGTEMYCQDEPCGEVFTVLDGWAFLYQILEDGRRQILDFALPGAFLGFQPDMDAPATHTAQCLTDVAVCVFPRKSLMKMFRAHPELAVRMAWISARDCALAHEHLTNVGRRSARERVAYLLLELFCRARRHRAATNEIELPLTQEHIGDAMGLTTVHVNRTLRALREDGLVDVHGGVLRILDPAALAELAGFDTPRLSGAA